ncbi:MAG: hypothetical protein GOU98_00795, partial [Candidatus Altiarchaeota archaeon]|nr:hypothetical protein [Candidatus Altiarchaeota archaeon]
GFDNIYAVGDVTNVEEPKTAQNAEKQAKIIVKSILSKKNVKYKSKRRPMLTSLGKNKGILTYKEFTLKGKIPALLKNFVEYKTLKKIKG